MDEFSIDLRADEPAPEFRIDLAGPTPTPQAEEFAIDLAPAPNATPIPADQYPTATKVPEDFYAIARADRPVTDVDVFAGPEHEIGAAGRADVGNAISAVASSLNPPRTAEETLVKEKGGNPLAFLAGVLRNEQSKIPNATKAAPWGLPMIASIAAPQNLAAQTGASLVGGAAGRYAEGKPVLQWGDWYPGGEPGVIQDLYAPLAMNLGIGVAKEGARYLSGVRTGAVPKFLEATDDIRKMLPRFEPVTPSGAAPQELPIKNKAQAAIDWGKDVLGSPIQRGFKSEIDEIRQVAKRLGGYAQGRNLLSEHIASKEREIFMQPAEGIRGKLNRYDYIPLSDREDMKLLLEGHKTIDQVSPLAAERAPLLKKFYDDFGEVGQELGLLHPGAPMVRSRYGTPDPAYSGPNIPKDPEEAKRFFDDLTRLRHEGRKTVGFHERVEHKYFEPEIHVADSLEGFQAYKKYAPEQFASAASFGAPGKYLTRTEEATGKRLPGATISPGTKRFVEERLPGATVEEGGVKAFGRDVNELLNRAQAGDLSSRERARMESMVGSLNQIYHTGERSPGANLVGKVVGTTLLPMSWLNQYGQQAWNIAKPGLQKNVQGLIRYGYDPEFRKLIQASGGRGSSMEHLFNELRGETGFAEDVVELAKQQLPAGISGSIERGMGRVGTSAFGRNASKLYSLLPENLVGKSIGWSESMLRGPLGAGHYVHSEDLIERALDAAAGGGRLSRGLARELREAGIDETALADPDLLRSAHTLRDTGARLTGRYQLMSGDPGHSSARLIGHPWGRVAGQFKSFPLGAARLFKSDVADPLWQGIRHGDMSELSLGAGRLARLAAAGYGSALAAEAAKETFKGKRPGEWDLSLAPSKALGSTTGMFGDIGQGLYEAYMAEDAKTGEWAPGQPLWKTAKRTLLPPVFSIGDQPTKTELALLLANALMPKAGAVMTMASPAWKEAIREKEDPIKALRRQIDEIRQQGIAREIARLRSQASGR